MSWSSITLPCRDTMATMRWLLIGFSLVALANCSKAKDCETGATRSCVCPEGGLGTETCSDHAFGACACKPKDDTMAKASALADAIANANRALDALDAKRAAAAEKLKNAKTAADKAAAEAEVAALDLERKHQLEAEAERKKRAAGITLSKDCLDNALGNCTK